MIPLYNRASSGGALTHAALLQTLVTEPALTADGMRGIAVRFLPDNLQYLTPALGCAACMPLPCPRACQRCGFLLLLPSAAAVSLHGNCADNQRTSQRLAALPAQQGSVRSRHRTASTAEH